MVRHGDARRRQQQNRLGKVTGKKVQGMQKKFAKLSTGRLRTMFPDLVHLSDAELKKEALKRLQKRD